MSIIDGKLIANEILEGLKKEVAQLSFQPVFCDVIVGDDPVTRSYVNTKAKIAEQIGVRFFMKELPITVETPEVISELKKIQQDRNLAGLIIQLPLPPALDKAGILNAIDPAVDVDCLSEINSQLFYAGQATLIPPTAAAILTVLDSLKQDLKNLDILVVGQGELVGRPITFLLQSRGYKVKTADGSTSDLKSLTSSADVIISGTGKAKLITGDMIKSGVIIIDCGTTESAGGIVGDVDFESVASKAGFVSPVPGGVGPVTVARLLFNVVQSAKDLKQNA